MRIEGGRGGGGVVGVGVVVWVGRLRSGVRKGAGAGTAY